MKIIIRAIRAIRGSQQPVDERRDRTGAMLSRRQAGEHASHEFAEHGDPATAVTPCHPP
jgi:hypothetical protein